jgi:hypothetical protein
MLKSQPASYKTLISELHEVLMCTKLSHYSTKSFAQHEALGQTYDSINELVDSITERILGYTNDTLTSFNFKEILSTPASMLGTRIIGLAERLEKTAKENNWPDVENLAQELSGVGAKLSYLGRFN